jgi:hypothetical protein
VSALPLWICWLGKRPSRAASPFIQFFTRRREPVQAGLGRGPPRLVTLRAFDGDGLMAAPVLPRHPGRSEPLDVVQDQKLPPVLSWPIPVSQGRTISFIV